MVGHFFWKYKKQKKGNMPPPYKSTPVVMYYVAVSSK